MRKYEIQITRTAEKQLRKLSRVDQIRIAGAMWDLGEEPRPRGSRKVSGYDDVFRIRVGVYRILYSISDDFLVIVIVKVGHRKDVYR